MLSSSGGGLSGIAARRDVVASMLRSTLNARLHREGAAAAAAPDAPREQQPPQEKKQKAKKKLEPPQLVDPLSFGDAGVCGGPGAVPSVEESLAAAAERLDASLEAAFEPQSRVRS